MAVTPTKIVDDAIPEVDGVVEEPAVDAERATKASSTKTYIVQARDTWGRLEDKFGKNLAGNNNLCVHDPLVAGQVLKVRS